MSTPAIVAIVVKLVPIVAALLSTTTLALISVPAIVARVVKDDNILADLSVTVNEGLTGIST
jgi:hypothetical protein